MKIIHLRNMYLGIFFMLSFTTNSMAQQGSWSYQSSGTTCYINSVFFTDTANGWYVGHCLNNGVIGTTNSGGKYGWWPSNNPPARTIHDIHFIVDNDTTYGWYVGTKGFIMNDKKTTLSYKGGLSQNSGTTETLKSVHFVDKNNGWAVGDCDRNDGHPNILHTSDGGENWVVQGVEELNLPYELLVLNSVFFTDSLNGWAVGRDNSFSGNNGRSIVNTSDGGSNWKLQNSGKTQMLNSVFFIDAKNGWVVGDEGIILNTTNGGSSWQEQNSGTSNYLHSVFFTTSTKGWAVGNSGKIIHTEDGGVTWTGQPSGATRALKSVFFINDSTGWAVGEGTIVHYSSNNTSSMKQLDRVIQHCKAYPNPFSNSTNFKFELKNQGQVKLDIIDARGSLIKTLIDRKLTPGEHSTTFNSADLSDGIYFYRLSSENFSETGKLIILQ